MSQTAAPAQDGIAITLPAPIAEVSPAPETAPASTAPASKVARPVAALEGPPEPAPVATPPAPKEPNAPASALVRLLLERGAALVASGDISGARLIFRRAATDRSAEGALQLAETYDPEWVTRQKLAAGLADAALARKWYLEAQALGSTEARSRLARLGGS